jgi:hypothetical protein
MNKADLNQSKHFVDEDGTVRFYMNDTLYMPSGLQRKDYSKKVNSLIEENDWVVQLQIV